MSAARKATEPAPQVPYEALQRELASGKPLARAYIVRGEEGYYREAVLRALCEAATRAGLELARHDAGDPDFKLSHLCDDLSSASMFAPARCIVVRRTNRLLSTNEEESASNGAAVEAAIAFARRKGEQGVLLLEGQGLRIDSALAKAVKEAGGPVLTLRKLYDSPPPWDRGADQRRLELVQWLLARARAAGIALIPDDAVFIAAATGNDLAALEAQLDRIKNRGDAAVRSVVPWTAGASPFKVAEHLLEGDLPRSLSGLEALFRSGFQGKEGRETNEVALVAMLLGSLRNKVSAMLEALDDPSVATSKDVADGLGARTPAEWERFAREVWALEGQARSGRGVDVDQFFAFALRTRSRRAARPAAAPARSYR